LSTTSTARANDSIGAPDGQAGRLVMRGLKGIPEYGRIVDKSITCIERLWQ